MKLILTLLTFLTAFVGNAAKTAEQVLDRVAANLSTPASASITFTLTPQGGSPVNGTMTICKRMFTFSAANLAVWFDGTTQWTLERSQAEVSIMTPTADEVAETNPLSILASFKKNYTAKMVAHDASTYKIRLTARSKAASITSATVLVNAKTMLPTAVTVTISGQTSTIRVNSFTKGKALPVSYFKFDPKLNPKITINDLR